MANISENFDFNFKLSQGKGNCFWTKIEKKNVDEATVNVSVQYLYNC